MIGSYTLSVGGFRPKTGQIDFNAPRPPLAYVMRNYERFGMSRPTQNKSPISILGLPDTCKFLNAAWIPLTESLQWYWFGLMKKYAPADWTNTQLKAAWKSLTHGARAFTNKHGWNDGYADYINNVNVDAPPMAYEPIVTGGNVVALASFDKVTIAGVVCYSVQMLDSDMPPSTYLDNRWLVQRATISRREGYNLLTGKWRREDREIWFPQLGGNDVPVPLLTKGGKNFIPVHRVSLLTSDDPIPTPYV